jgi:hypothetical protein
LRKLTDRERSWPIFDLELLAVVSAFEDWREWLMGTDEPVKVYSDHSNLMYFKSAKYLSPKQARWACYLDKFNILIYHIPGKKNPADAPSRREDFVADRPTIPESTSLRDKFVMASKLENSDRLHDLHFQRPNTELLMFLKKNYSDSDKELRTLTMIDEFLWH